MRDNQNHKNGRSKNSKKCLSFVPIIHLNYNSIVHCRYRKNDAANMPQTGVESLFIDYMKLYNMVRIISITGLPGHFLLNFWQK